MNDVFVNLEVMEKHLPDIGSDTDFVGRKNSKDHVYD